MTIGRWDPLRDMIALHEAMNRLVNESFGRPGTVAPAAPLLRIAVDVYETDAAVIILAALPGVAEEDVHLSATAEALTISAQARTDEDLRSARPLLRERGAGAAERTIMLPPGLHTEAIEARLERGTLRIHLPKGEGLRRRQVPVRFAPPEA